MVSKTNILGISVLISVIVTFMSKKESSLLVTRKMLKITERKSLAICGSLCGEKQFLLAFIPFYWFDQKKLFKKIQIFLRIFPLQTWLEKKNF